MKGRAGVMLALVAMVAAAVASTAGAGSSAVAASQAVNCKGTLKLALITPLTGGAGFLGKEQSAGPSTRSRPWPEVRPQGAARHGRHAGREGQRRGARRRAEVHRRPEGSSRFSDRRRRAPSRRRAERSSGRGSPTSRRRQRGRRSRRAPTRRRRTAFFRVVPGDYIQGPTDASYMVDKLKAKKVVIVDFQEPYSVGLADAAEAVLKAKGVSVSRQSASVNTTDFSSLVTKVPSDADVVFFPTQQPADAQTFAQQLLEQGKKAKVFGGDGTNEPDRVQGRRLVRLELRARHQRHRGEQGADRRVEEGQPECDARLVRAARLPRGRGRAERDQEGVRRGQRPDHEPEATSSATSRRSTSRTGSSAATFRFSTKSNDPLNAKFYIFQIQSNGTYKLVG